MGNSKGKYVGRWIIRLILGCLFAVLATGIVATWNSTEIDEFTEPCAAEYVEEREVSIDGVPVEIRGMLLSSRFRTLEELEEVIQVDYFPDGIPGVTSDSAVLLSHCSNQLQIKSLLAAGPDEMDFKLAYSEGFWSKALLGLEVPFAVSNREQLQKVYFLARRRQGFFGEGDPAFFDLALEMVNHIKSPGAYLTEADSSEKGYLNTFNHVTAQAFITTLYSEEVADFVADVHERSTMPELISGEFTPEQLADPIKNPVDNYVDIVNNEWGQELGKRLRKKYQITSTTEWTPELLILYLNDIQAYYAWGLGIGLIPFREEDRVIKRFVQKLNFIRLNPPNYKIY